MMLDLIGKDSIEEICSYLKIEDIANLEQTCKKLNIEIENTNVWKRQANRLLQKFPYKFLQDAHQIVHEIPEQQGQNYEKHQNKWIISLVTITNNTFKEFKWSCFWEDNFCDPNFSDNDSEEYDEDNYERGVASFKRTEELKISRGDTLALKRCTFCVVDKEIELEINDINTLDLSISPNFYGQYATWLKKYVELKDDILTSEQDVLWSTI